MDKLGNFSELSESLEKLTYPAKLDAKQLLKESKEISTQNALSGSSSEHGSSPRRRHFKSKVAPILSFPDSEPDSKMAARRASHFDVGRCCGDQLAESCGENYIQPVQNSDLRFRSFSPQASSPIEDHLEKFNASGIVAQRLRQITNDLCERTNRVKELILLPPTPSTCGTHKGEAPDPPPLKRPLSNLLGEGEVGEGEEDEAEGYTGLVGVSSSRARLLRYQKWLKSAFRFPETIELESRLNVSWLFLITMCYLYNAWVIPMRSVFTQYQTEENLPIWLAVDYFCDLLYILDIVLFKCRVQFILNGSWVTEAKEIKAHYLKSRRFLLDLLCLFPFDLLYIFFGPISILRLPRLLKLSMFLEFFERLDSLLAHPFIARMLRTIISMLYMIHLNSLVYYGFSKLQGIGSDSFVYNGKGNAYVRCSYFAIKTSISIGKNPKPVNIQEEVLMTFSWLTGVFVFAVLLGQVKDIVLTATKNRDEYKRVVDQTLTYLHKFHVPKDTIDRVRLWFSYTWNTQQTLDEIAPLKVLPQKLQLDIAINVHIHTLSKVQLFQDCDDTLLRDLVLKLKPVIYLPGDYVCKKGEIGKEMYIVKMGHIQVVGGPNGDTVFATLMEGSVFGEISLLALDGGGNRRTADVRSLGYSNLFVLSKEDLEITIKDHPDAQRVLERKAAKLIQDSKSREKKSIKDEALEGAGKKKEKNPKLLEAVFKTTQKEALQVVDDWQSTTSLDSDSHPISEDHLSVNNENEFANKEGIIDVIETDDTKEIENSSSEIAQVVGLLAEEEDVIPERINSQASSVKVVDLLAEEEGIIPERIDSQASSVKVFDDGTVFIPKMAALRKYSIRTEDRKLSLPSSEADTSFDPPEQESLTSDSIPPEIVVHAPTQSAKDVKRRGIIDLERFDQNEKALRLQLSNKVDKQPDQPYKALSRSMSAGSLSSEGSFYLEDLSSNCSSSSELE